MKSKIALLGTVAALSLIAAQESSARHQGWYVGIEAGANWIDDTDFTQDFTYQDEFLADVELAAVGPSYPEAINFDTGWAALGTVGYAFDNNWRIEGELGYRSNDADVNFYFGGKQSYATSGDLTEYTAMVNVLYDIPVAEKLNFTVGAGVGADFSKFDDGDGLKDDDVSFAYQAIAGLSYALTDRLDLTLTYRYLHVNSPEYSESFGGYTEAYALDDLEKHTVTVGLRYDLYEDEAPMVATPAAPPPAPMTEPTKQFIVFFGFNKSNLTPEAMSVIKEAAAAAKSQGSASIVVVGHTDTVGSNKYNDALSLRRSGAVKQGLVAEGIAASGITASGKGESELMVQTGDNAKEPQNRRATIDLN